MRLQRGAAQESGKGRVPATPQNVARVTQTVFRTNFTQPRPYGVLGSPRADKASGAIERGRVCGFDQPHRKGNQLIFSVMWGTFSLLLLIFPVF